MKTRIISHDTDLGVFAQTYTTLSGHESDLNFFKQASRVRAFYDAKNNMCGGYVINKNAPQRLLNDIVDKHLILDSTVNEDNSVENCCIWMSPSLSKFNKGVIYVYNAIDLLAQKRKYVICGAKNESLAKRFRRAYPHYLYRGPAHTGGSVHILYASSVSSILSLAVISYVFFIKPLFTFRKSNRYIKQ